MKIVSSQPTIDKFNAMFPVGSKCQWRSIGKDGVPFQTVTVEHPAYDLHGQAVAFFAERRGCCSVDLNFVDYKAAEEESDANHEAFMDYQRSIRQ